MGQKNVKLDKNDKIKSNRMKRDKMGKNLIKCDKTG